MNFEENFKSLAKYAQFSHNKKKLNITNEIDIQSEFIKILFNLFLNFDYINKTGTGYITDIIYDF